MDADVYVLANDRSVQIARDFLEKYLPERRFDSDRYEIYFYEGDKELNFLFSTEMEMLHFFECHRDIAFCCSFSPLKKTECIRKGFLYYLKDGGMICCMNIYQDDKKEDYLLEDLKNFLDSKYGLISYHIPLPNTKLDFFNKVSSR